VRTPFDLGLVFSDFDLHRRQVKDLTLDHGLDRCLFQGSLTMMALGHHMNLGVLGLSNLVERLARMPWLSATGLATGRSQTVYTGFLEPIAGGRFATVLAILGELIFQGLNPCLQRTNDGNQSVDQVEDGFFAVLVCRAHLFVCR